MLTEQENRDILIERRREIRYRINEMKETLVECDWCCGGGDEEMDELVQERFDINKELAFKNPGEK
jgi:hypothetical protein